MSATTSPVPQLQALRVQVKGQAKPANSGDQLRTQPPTPAPPATADQAIASGTLSTAESNTADLLACGLFEDELEELLLSHSPKSSSPGPQQQLS